MYEKHLENPLFNWINNDIISIINKLNCGNISKILPGDTIIWINNDCGYGKTKYIKTKVVHIKKYKNFEEMFKKEKLKDIVSLNFINTKKKALELLNNNYKKKLINKYGIISIKIKKIS